LITISRENLIQICKKYPNIEIALKGLYEFESIASREDRYKDMQKGARYKRPIKMSLEIYPKTSFNYPIIVEGYSKDISIGGTCVILDAKDTPLLVVIFSAIIISICRYIVEFIFYVINLFLIRNPF
jgi:hypothetical protein